MEVCMSQSRSEIRIAQITDSQAILDIYAPYVEKTAITFTSRVPTLEDIAQTMIEVKRRFPYLVCVVDDQVVGFAYASWVRPHEACRWNAELSVYIDPEHQGSGLATALYTALIPLLKSQGYCNIYAVITLPNEASIALHKHFGFTELSVHKANGYKLGAWRDVLWMEYRIPGACDPAVHGVPVPLQEVNANDVATTLAMASAVLNGTR
jgi:phosphinothricin acetyltransferase